MHSCARLEARTCWASPENVQYFVEKEALIPGLAAINCSFTMIAFAVSPVRLYEAASTVSAIQKKVDANLIAYR